MVLPLPSTYPVPPSVLPASTVPVAIHAPCALSPDQTSDAVEGRSAGVRPSLHVSQATCLATTPLASLSGCRTAGLCLEAGVQRCHLGKLSLALSYVVLAL